MNRKLSTRKLVVSAMLSAVSLILGLTPLGIIPLPVANLTTMHIPAILAGILEGPLVGLWVGLLFGLTSLYKAVTQPTSILSAFLVNPLVSVLPRMLIGVAAWAVYAGVRALVLGKKTRSARTQGVVTSVASGAAAFIATMVNTAGVMGMVFLLSAPEYAQASGIDLSAVGAAIWGVCVSNGLLEAAAAVVLVVALERVLRPLVRAMRSREKEREK